MRRSWRGFLVAIVVALVVAVPLLYSAHRQNHLRNFRVVEEGVLYRSGQLTQAGLERVLHDYKIKSVVTLRTVRTPGMPYPDGWEKTLCEGRGLNHFRIPPRVWGPDEKGEIPAEEAVQEFLKVMSNPANHPVLVHCFAGIHRTGTMCSIYRMEYDHWTPDRAIAEMQSCGFDPEDMHEHIEGYLRNYHPRSNHPATTPTSGK